MPELPACDISVANPGVDCLSEENCCVCGALLMYKFLLMSCERDVQELSGRRWWQKVSDLPRGKRD